MIQWHIGHQTYRHYVENGEGFVTGTAFLGDKALKGEALLKHVSAWETIDDWKQGLLGLNGFYAIVLRKESKVFAAVDRIRSIPIFYGQLGQDIFISDDTRWVKEKVKDFAVDSLAHQEFLLTGFITGQETLFPNIKQIQAGEVVLFGIDETGQIKKEAKRYYSYLHTNYFEKDEQELYLKLDDILTSVFHRLIHYASGRTIAVPLSGGYDSRLIVLMLKKLGYENIIAFSYGKPENEEAEISRFIAGKLGIKWEFIPYSNGLWYDWYRSPEMRKYFKFADGLASLPHIQDWPAVWLLKQGNRIPDDAIFVPGIAADLNTGGFIEKYPEIYSSIANKKDLLRLIIKYSYSLFPFDHISKHNRSEISKNIEDMLEKPPYGFNTGENFECWVSVEKVAKFVFNSVRAYEFFGFNWWTPFWDMEFVDFWYNVPINLRCNQKLYKYTISRLTNGLNLFGDIDPLFRDGHISDKANSIPIKYSYKNNLLKKYFVYIAKSILPEFIKKIIIQQRHLTQFDNHPLQWYGIHDPDYVCDQIKKGATMINAFLSMDYFTTIEAHHIFSDK